MEFQNILKLLATGIVTLAIGGFLGYQYAPERIKTVDKIIEKEVTKIVHEKFDPNTGKVIERTTTDETKNNTSISTKEQMIKKDKHYAIKAGAVINPRDLSSPPAYRIGAEVKLPILPIWLGAEGDLKISSPNVGAYLRMEF